MNDVAYVVENICPLTNVLDVLHSKLCSIHTSYLSMCRRKCFPCLSSVLVNSCGQVFRNGKFKFKSYSRKKNSYCQIKKRKFWSKNYSLKCWSFYHTNNHFLSQSENMVFSRNPFLSIKHHFEYKAQISKKLKVTKFVYITTFFRKIKFFGKKIIWKILFWNIEKIVILKKAFQ